MFSAGAIPLESVTSITVCQKPLPLLVLRTTEDAASDLVLYIETGSHDVEMAACIVQAVFIKSRKAVDVTVEREIPFVIKAAHKVRLLLIMHVYRTASVKTTMGAQCWAFRTSPSTLNDGSQAC